MSRKAIRSIMIAALFALAIVIHSPVFAAPMPAHATTPAMLMAEEHGTTAS